MRWADLDLLGHVNNVVYVDYLQEARVDMVRTHAPDPRADDLAEGVVVVRSEVTYLAPLGFRFRPVSIECWVTEIRAASFTMAYEIFDEHGGARTTYVRASTVLSPYVFTDERPRRLSADERAALVPFLEADRPAAPGRPPLGGASREIAGHHYPVAVRFSDVDVYGHVNNVTYFEYFQEGRVALFDEVRRRAPTGDRQGTFVVAHSDVEYRVPVLFRAEPYDQWSRVSRVGTTSVTIEAEICDGDELLSRSRVVLVFWDPVAGRPVPPGPADRAALLAVG